MSTLEELKKQASDITQRNTVKTSSTEDDSQLDIWHKLAPVMKYLQDHFLELAESLNVLGREILVDFKINDSVSIRNLKARNYKLTHPSADKEKEFVFEFENAGEMPAYAMLVNGSPATTFKDNLSKYKIKHKATRTPDNKQVKFEISPLVRTTYHFAADLENEMINLTITNYKEMWGRTNKFKKNQITTELMDEITKHVLRDVNKYDEMVGNVVSEEERTKIREKLQTQLKAQAAAEQTGPQPQAQQPDKKEKTLFGKLFKK